MTTATDVAHFWRALLGGELLSPAQLKTMKKTVPVGEGLPLSYGLGIFKYDQYPTCGTMWGHGGDIPGFSTEFLNSEDGKIQSADAHLSLRYFASCALTSAVPFLTTLPSLVVSGTAALNATAFFVSA